MCSRPKPQWKHWAYCKSDERIVLLHEPDQIDVTLERLVAPCATTPNLWTDAYLAAFAIIAGLKLVSFDCGFAKFPGLDFLRLPAGATK